jgi:hypothetical protein
VLIGDAAEVRRLAKRRQKNDRRDAGLILDLLLRGEFLRHMAVNLLKQERSCKLGIKSKRLKAGWDESYMLKVLNI